jgi:5-bromo-4-chloroindolyl phosphate hydrolysis protein
MKTRFFLTTIIAFAIGIGSTTAQIRQTQKNEKRRIAQGVKSGELTKAEVKNLRNDQKEIKEDIKEARADGKITPQERKEMKKDQRQASREIYRKKHNRRDRN